VLIHRMKVGQGHDYELLYDGEGKAGHRFPQCERFPVGAGDFTLVGSGDELWTPLVSTRI